MLTGIAKFVACPCAFLAMLFWACAEPTDETEVVEEIGVEQGRRLAERGNLLLKKSRPRQALVVLEQAVSVLPNSGEIYFRIGLAQAQLELHGEAIVAFQRARNLGLHSATLFFAMASSLYSHIRYVEGAESVQQAIEIAPNRAHYHVLLGKIWQALGHFGRSRQVFAVALALNPHDVEALLLRADLLAQGDSVRLAEILLQRVVTLDSRSVVAHVQLGNLYLNEQRFEVAEDVLRRAIALAPRHSEAHRLLGTVLSELGKQRSGQRHLERGRQLNKVQEYLKQGNLFTRRRRWAAAVTFFERAIQQDSSFADAYLRLATLRLQCSNTSAALNLLILASRWHPDHPEVHYLLGHTYLQQRRWVAASRKFTEVLKLDPASARAFYGLGRALLAQGNPEPAIRAFQQALRYEPEHRDAHYFLGRAFEHEQLYDKARESLETSLVIDSSLVDAHRALGRLYMRAGRPDKARIVFSRALTLEPEDADFRLELREIDTRPTFLHNSP